MLIDLNNTNFCKNIRYLRKKNYLSQRALAELSGISLWMLRRIEEASDPPAVDDYVVRRLCQIFGLSVETLFHARFPIPEEDRIDSK